MDRRLGYELDSGGSNPSGNTYMVHIRMVRGLPAKQLVAFRGLRVRVSCAPLLCKHISAGQKARLISGLPQVRILLLALNRAGYRNGYNGAVLKTDVSS